MVCEIFQLLMLFLFYLLSFKRRIFEGGFGLFWWRGAVCLVGYWFFKQGFNSHVSETAGRSFLRIFRKKSTLISKNGKFRKKKV